MPKSPNLASVGMHTKECGDVWIIWDAKEQVGKTGIVLWADEADQLATDPEHFRNVMQVMHAFPGCTLKEAMAEVQT